MMHTNTDMVTKALVRVWNDDKELVLTLDYLNGLELEAIEYSINNLIAQLDTLKYKKKFYNMNLCNSPYIWDIDEYFKNKFSNPDNKWELKMHWSGDRFIRKWGKVEVSFTLC